MAVTAQMAGKFMLSVLNKEVDVDADTFRARLVTSSYTFNVDTHQYASSITNELSTAGGYTAGGVALTGVTITYDSATNKVVIDCDDIVVAAATISPRGMVIIDATPASDATRPIVGYIDFGADVPSSGGDWTYTVPAGGLATFAV